MPFIVWILKTLILYFLFFIFVPVLVDSITKNSFSKYLVLFVAGCMAAIVMAWLDYTPYLLFIFAFLSNKNRLSTIFEDKFAQDIGFIPNKKLFYFSSYFYIVIACFGAWFLQIEVSSFPYGEFIPLWRQLIDFYN